MKLRIIIMALFLMFSGCNHEVIRETSTISQCQTINLDQTDKSSLNSLLSRYFTSGPDVSLVIEGRMTIDIHNRYYILGRSSAIYLVKDNQALYTIRTK